MAVATQRRKYQYGVLPPGSPFGGPNTTPTAQGGGGGTTAPWAAGSAIRSNPDGTFSTPSTFDTRTGQGDGSWVGSGRYPVTDLVQRMRDTMAAEPANLAAELAWNDPTPNTALGYSIGEGFRLRDEGERRRTETLGFLESESARADKPTISDEDLRNMFSREAGRINRNANGQNAALRSAFGGMGTFGGGQVQGMAQQVQLQKYQALLGANLDTKLKKAASDALDRANRFQRSQMIAGVMNEDPNQLGLDVLGEFAGVRLAQDLGQKQVDAANTAANASRSAGTKGLIGSVLGGIIGAI